MAVATSTVYRRSTDFPSSGAWGALRRFTGHPTVRYQRFLVFLRFSSQAVAFAVFCCDGGRCRRLKTFGFESGPDPSGVARVTRFLDDELTVQAFAEGRVYTTMADADLV